MLLSWFRCQERIQFALSVTCSRAPSTELCTRYLPSVVFLLSCLLGSMHRLIIVLLEIGLCGLWLFIHIYTYISMDVSVPGFKELVMGSKWSYMASCVFFFSFALISVVLVLGGGFTRYQIANLPDCRNISHIHLFPGYFQIPSRT